MSPIISVQNLGKKYILNHQSQESYVSLREVLAQKSIQLGQRLRHPFKRKIDLRHEDFWALKDINFDIQQGDKVGIIGRNGSGKSTLLKILSRITEPTTGTLKMKGRVSSLLEVGTGFHPELTGRENVYLNGAILGMSHKEIKSKFDEIVAFAEVDKFLDTPVKRYSSGMHMRLAFAVAAHLEPDILIVDEVLAVGDAQFQKKCIGKMKEAGSEGRTVLFVSHNIDAVKSLCDKGILLNGGRLECIDTAAIAIQTYMFSGQDKDRSVNNCHRVRKGGIEIKDVWIADNKNKAVTRVGTGSGVVFFARFSIEDYLISKTLVVGFSVETMDGRKLFTMVSSWRDMNVKSKTNEVIVKCTLPFLSLRTNNYLISCSVVKEGVAWDYVFQCASFEVESGANDFYPNIDKEHGDFLVPYEFECN